MAQAKKGDRVKVHFTGRFEDGTVFESTHDEKECGCEDCGCDHGPVELILGEEEFFTQLEDALVGMAPGEKKTVPIPKDEAFGDYDEEAVFAVDKEQVPDELDAHVGQELELTDENDDSFVVTVLEVNDQGLVLDANHPLAGKDLAYEVELVEIL